ncbi:MAG TPA: hypothetical protein VFW66_10660 [Gemmatimonadales bacterium]|nr:hypothetical protein [Gemmatimonadales bacterium]
MRGHRRTATRRAVAGVLGGALAAACVMSTARPDITPLPEAVHASVDLPVRDATQRLAEGLRSDSIPVTKIEPRDGYLETPWFDAESGTPTDRSPLGPDVVKVRAFIDPARVGQSDLDVETVFRGVSNPAVPSRELEQIVPSDHVVVKRVQAALDELVRRYGEPAPAAAVAPATGDTTRPDSVRVDSFQIAPPAADSIRADSSRIRPRRP